MLSLKFHQPHSQHLNLPTVLGLGLHLSTASQGTTLGGSFQSSEPGFPAGGLGGLFRGLKEEVNIKFLGHAWETRSLLLNSISPFTAIQEEKVTCLRSDNQRWLLNGYSSVFITSIFHNASSFSP